MQSLTRASSCQTRFQMKLPQFTCRDLNVSSCTPDIGQQSHEARCVTPLCSLIGLSNHVTSTR